MPAKPRIDAAAEIEADEIVGIDLEGLVEFPKPLFRAATEVVDSAGEAVDVWIERIELLRAARRRQSGVLASRPCRPTEPDVGEPTRRVERDTALKRFGRRPRSVGEQQRESASAVSVPHTVVESERTIHSVLRPWIGVLLPFESIERLDREEVRQPHPRQHVVRILARGLLEEFPRPLE